MSEEPVDRIGQAPAAAPALCAVSTFSAEAISPTDPFEAWRALIGLTHDVTAEPASFFGQLRTTRVSEMLVHVMDAAPQAVARSSEQVRKDGLDHLVLHLSSSAQGFSAGEREQVVPPGAITLNDVARTHRRVEAPERGSIILSLPRDLVTEALPNLNGLHGRTLHAGMGSLMREHMRTLARNAAVVHQTAAAEIARSTVAMLAACLDAGPDAVESARAPLERALVQRAKRYIDAHLASPALTPDRICEGLRTSRSTLFRAFKPLGGVANVIWERRVQGVRRELMAGTGATIVEIGERYGFATSAQISHSFRRRFSMSPSDFRRAQVSHIDDSLVRSGGSSLFADWVRQHG